MNWDAIGAIAEVVGVVGILVSLMYLAVQIRQNTRQISSNIEATRLAAFEHNIESGNRIRELYILHPELSELFLKATKQYQDLSSTDRFRFSMLLRNTFSSMQGAYVRQLSLEHDPYGVEGIETVMDELLSNQGVRQVITSIKPDWRPEFRKFVDSRLALFGPLE